MDWEIFFFVCTLKGAGFVYPGTYGSRKDNYQGKNKEEQTVSIHKTVEFPWGYKVLGLADSRVWGTLVDEEHKLTEKGLRCEAILKVLPLNQVCLRNKEGEFERVGIRRLRTFLKGRAEKEGFADLDMKIDLNEYQPVLIVRLMRCNTRIKDFCKPKLPNGNPMEEFAVRDYRKTELEKVFKTLNLEFKGLGENKSYDVNDPDSIKEYIQDTFYTAGKNLAILQNGRRVMWFLNSGNMTLSLAEVVDLDSVVPFVGSGRVDMCGENHPDYSQLPVGLVKDVRDELFALGRMWLNSFEVIFEFDEWNDKEEGDRKKFCKKFLEGYKANINQDLIDTFLKVNDITNEGFDYKLSDNEKENAFLKDFLKEHVSLICDLKAIEDEREREKYLNNYMGEMSKRTRKGKKKGFDKDEFKTNVNKLLSALSGIEHNRGETLLELVKSFAEKIIVAGESIRPIKSPEKSE